MDVFAVDPATWTRPTVYIISISLALASGLGYKAYRLGLQHGGPIVTQWLR
jgi:hypothetical protein